MRTTIQKTILIFALAVVTGGCARVGPPPGGPEDKRPPKVLSTTPEQGAINVDTEIELAVEFDESVQRRTLSQAFSLSPPPPGTVRADWSGHTLKLRFDPPLKDDRTYVLTLGTRLSDKRGNALKEAFHLAFSTGDKLDRGRLEGMLKAAGTASGWNVYGYLLQPAGSDSLPDDSLRTPDPSREIPDAATQAGQEGGWSLLNLRPGIWRVFAFKDQDDDRLWTPWLEPLAVPPFDVEAREDTTFDPRDLILVGAERPWSIEPVRATARIRDEVTVQFSRKPPELEGEFQVVGPPADAPMEYDWEVLPQDLELSPRKVAFKPGDSSSVVVRLDGIPESEGLWLRVMGDYGMDAGIDTTMPVNLAQSSRLDTFPPVLLANSPEEGSRLHRGTPPVRLTFSEDVSIVDTSRFRWISGRTDTLGASLSHTAPNRLQAVWEGHLDSPGLKLEFFGDAVADPGGVNLRDSVTSVTYTWLPDDSLGTVAGTVMAPSDGGQLYMILRDLRKKDLPLHTRLEKPGSFTFGEVPAGIWQLEGWQDRDSSGAWSRGQAVPFVPADPWYLGTDTIQVRARWESGGVRAIFP